jgi:hypothetical protein
MDRFCLARVLPFIDQQSSSLLRRDSELRLKFPSNLEDYFAVIALFRMPAG